MGVVFADHIANHAGAFLEARDRVELEQAHGIKDAPVHWFQPIAHIGQGAVHDGRQRIGEIALFKRLANGDLLVAGGRRIRWWGEI